MQDIVHKQIVRHLDKVEAWFTSVRKSVDVPFYSSYDIRDSGHKVTNVDGNIFPAGFNNICNVDRENAGALVRRYLDCHYPMQCEAAAGGADCVECGVKRILIITEEHTNNPYYWDNVAALSKLITDAGVEVRLAFPRLDEHPVFTMKSASGHELQVHTVVAAEGKISSPGFEADLVVSNNDFSDFYENLGAAIETPMNPPRELGWYQRKKSTYFRHYNELCVDFAKVIDVDPWLLTVETELFEHFDIAEEASREALAQRVEAMLARIRTEYSKRGLSEEPFVFVKNNAGTYGLAVMRVSSGDEIRALNYKTRKKMKAAKGGRDVEEVIIQEGVPSIVVSDGVTAEPTVYLIGCQLVGGFLRTHREKGPTESLNSPGAVYKRMCVSDLKVSVEGHPLENVYGWVAKLGLLAIGRESTEMKVQFKNYLR